MKYIMDIPILVHIYMYNKIDIWGLILITISPIYGASVQFSSATKTSLKNEMLQYANFLGITITFKRS